MLVSGHDILDIALLPLQLLSLYLLFLEFFLVVLGQGILVLDHLVAVMYAAREDVFVLFKHGTLCKMSLLHIDLLGEVVVEELDPAPERLQVWVHKDLEDILELQLDLLDDEGVSGV